MIKLSKSKLATILNNHKLWLLDDSKGKRANLSGADLSGADLSGANLFQANLSGANLFQANLFQANLSGANLFQANLSGADLFQANLSGADLFQANLSVADLFQANLSVADLSEANLFQADLFQANLSGANLSGANLSDVRFNENTAFLTLQCPETGSFIGYKALHGSLIAKLEIQASSKRSSATSRKCRASKVKVLKIYNPEEKYTLKDGYSEYNDIITIYETGKMVYPDSFDENRWNECSNGIHFFITEQEAINYSKYR